MRNQESFKVSTDPNFAVKVEDIIGLYLDPPERALVLAIDEKSQIQALDRTQPGLPLKKGRAGTMTHDYKRNGTTTLFAALDIVIGVCLARHRADEFLAWHCHVCGFYLSIGRGALSPHVYISMT